MTENTALSHEVTKALAFLIAHQENWKPELDIHIGGGQTRTVPLTLIAKITND